MSVIPAHLGQIDLTIPIEASTQRIWKALVDESTDWWNRDFLVGPGAKGFYIEPKVGGRVYEDWGEGTGTLWYTVTGVRTGEYLELVGHVFPGFGGPITSMLRLSLTASGSGTLLKLTDGLLGRLTDEKVQMITDGWRQLFEIGFKQYVEDGVRA